MDNVNVCEGLITVKGYDYYLGCTYHLTIKFAGVLAFMNLSDFAKMLKVVGSVLDPSDYYVYLHYWHKWLDEQVPKARLKELPRLQRMLARVDKALDKLPLWAMQDPDDRPDREDPE